MESQNEKKLIPLGELFSQTWKFYSEHFKNLMSIAALILLPIFISIIPALFITNTFILLPVTLIVYLASVVVCLIGEITLLQYIKEKNLNFDIKKVFLKEAKSKFWSFLWINFLVGILVVLGFVALIIPGFYLLVAFIFSSYVLIDQNKRGMEALKESKKLAKGYFWPIFGRIVLMYLIFIVVQMFGTPLMSFSYSYILSNVFSLVISFFFVPFAMAYIFNIYENLKRIKG